MTSRGGRALAAGGALALSATAARAEPAGPVTGALTFHADQLDAARVGANTSELSLRGHVEVAYDRYRLWADRVHLELHDGVVVFSGEVRVAPCPCGGAPLTFLASGGRFDPPGDLILRFPRLALGGVPVLALPVLWIRAPDRVGLLPPMLEVRGSDGVLLGSGVHLPWLRAGALEWLDVTGGGYVRGGADAGAHLVTTGSETRVVADWIGGTRVALDGRGAVLAQEGRAFGVAWSADGLRGDRALAGTTDLGAAARPFDTATAEVSLATHDSRAASLTTATSGILGAAVDARALRGLGPIAVGPRVTLALGGPSGRLGSWSVDAGFATLAPTPPAEDARLGDTGSAASLARAAAAGEIDLRPGPFELRASAAARGRFAAGVSPDGPSTDAATAARADLELPFAREFPGAAPLVHWIVPAVTVQGALAAEHGLFFTPIGGPAPPASWLGAGGVSTALGRAGSSASSLAASSLRFDLRVGATGVAGATDGLAHARLRADARLLAADVEGAAVRASGAALVGRLRFGDATGAWVRVEAAGQTGEGAGEARAIARDTWAALPEDTLAYLSARGLTGAGEVQLPWGRGISTGARADVDLDARSLLAIRGSGVYRHPCGCLALGLAAAHRVGRDGIDARLTIDVAPSSTGGGAR